MIRFSQRIVNHKLFEPFIIGVIILCGIIVGLETSESFVGQYGQLFYVFYSIILVIFILEALLKMTALAPDSFRYFKNGWNLFDFFVIIIALIPNTGQFAMVARLVRLLRVLRLISAVPEIRLIVNTLLRSIPSLANILVLLFLLFYIYGVTGYFLYHTHDPLHWETLGMSMITLFRVLTLEDWTDIMYKAMELNFYHWTYFVSFVIITTFVVINMFVAIILNNLDETKKEHSQEKHELRQLEEVLSSKQIRVQCQLPATIKTEELTAKTVIRNISIKGCRVLFRNKDALINKFAIGENISLTSVLPFAESEINFSGEIRSKNEGKYIASLGIEFGEVNKETLKTLTNFIVSKLNV